MLKTALLIASIAAAPVIAQTAGTTGAISPPSGQEPTAPSSTQASGAGTAHGDAGGTTGTPSMNKPAGTNAPIGHTSVGSPGTGTTDPQDVVKTVTQKRKARPR